MTFPYEATVQSMRDIKSQAPDAICELTPTPVAFNLLVNREAAPFDDPDIRRAMQLTIDRKSFHRHPLRGTGRYRRGDAAAARRAVGPAAGNPPTLPGYGPDVAANRAEARKLMEKHGYGPATPAPGQGRDPQHRAIPRPGRDPDRPAEGDLYRRRAGRRRNRQLVSQDRPQGLSWSAPICRGRGSTTPTPISTSIMPAARSAITPTTATPSSKKCTSSNRSSRTRKSAKSSSGRSTAG